MLVAVAGSYARAEYRYWQPHEMPEDLKVS